MRLRWSARAAGQLVDVVRCQESERASSGTALLHAIDELAGLLGERPRCFPCAPGARAPEVRRALLRRWGYWLVYELRESEGVVLALWHARRSPDGWRPPRPVPPGHEGPPTLSRWRPCRGDRDWLPTRDLNAPPAGT